NGQVAHGDHRVDGGFADVHYVVLVTNNQLAIKLACRQTKIQIHPVVQHFVIEGGVQLFHIQVGVNISICVDDVKTIRTNRAAATLGDTGVAQPDVRQHRHRMFEVSGKVGVAVAAHVEVFLDINGRVLVHHLTGEIRIPIADIGAYAQNISVGQRGSQHQRATHSNHQFTHNAPVLLVVLTGQSKLMPRRRPTSS